MKAKNIVIDNLNEILGIGDHKRKYGGCLGSKLIDFEVLIGEEAYCADEEILMNFDNGKEIRIYIDEKGKLHIYSD